MYERARKTTDATIEQERRRTPPQRQGGDPEQAGGEEQRRRDADHRLQPQFRVERLGQHRRLVPHLRRHLPVAPVVAPPVRVDDRQQVVAVVVPVGVREDVAEVERGVERERPGAVPLLGVRLAVGERTVVADSLVGEPRRHEQRRDRRGRDAEPEHLALTRPEPGDREDDQHGGELGERPGARQVGEPDERARRGPGPPGEAVPCECPHDDVDGAGGERGAEHLRMVERPGADEHGRGRRERQRPHPGGAGARPELARSQEREQADGEGGERGEELDRAVGVRDPAAAGRELLRAGREHEEERRVVPDVGLGGGRQPVRVLDHVDVVRHRPAVVAVEPGVVEHVPEE